MLDIQRGPYVDARVEQFLDVLPALGMATVRGVGVGKLVDNDQLGPSRQRGVDVELFDRLAAIADDPARQNLEVLRAARLTRLRPCDSTKPTTTSALSRFSACARWSIA